MQSVSVGALTTQIYVGNICEPPPHFSVPIHPVRIFLLQNLRLGHVVLTIFAR